MLTLHPQAFGADFLLARCIQIAGLSFKPSHKRLAIEKFLILDPSLRHHTLLVRMLYLAHFCNRIG
jgi:hypothetical protein